MDETKTNRYLIPVAIVVAALIIGGSLFFALRGSKTQTPATLTGTTPALSQKIEVGFGTIPIFGKKDAPLTLIEFLDYQCLFCQRFFLQTMSQLIRKYVDAGQLKIVFRDFAFLDGFPGVQGKESHWAAEAARCAGEQGKYYEYHSILFNNQKGENVGSFTQQNLKRFAQQTGLNSNEFNQCFDSGKYIQAVLDDTQFAGRAGVRGTPGIFIGYDKIYSDPAYIQSQLRSTSVVVLENAVYIGGALPFEVFDQTIQQLLSQKR